MLEKGGSGKPGLLMAENTLDVPKKSKAWIFKIILILVILAGVYYLYINRQELIINPVNRFFERFS